MISVVAIEESEDALEETKELVLSDVEGVEVISVILLEQPLTKDVNNTIGKNNFLNFMI